MVDRESASVDMFSGLNIYIRTSSIFFLNFNLFTFWLGLDDRRRTVDIDAEYAGISQILLPFFVLCSW